MGGFLREMLGSPRGSGGVVRGFAQRTPENHVEPIIPSWYAEYTTLVNVHENGLHGP